MRSLPSHEDDKTTPCNKRDNQPHLTLPSEWGGRPPLTNEWRPRQFPTFLTTLLKIMFSITMFQNCYFFKMHILKLVNQKNTLSSILFYKYPARPVEHFWHMLSL